MAELREMLEDAGAEKARTLLQSGNAVFESKRSAAALEPLLEKAAKERFALETSVFLRTAAEWDELLAANPFPHEAKDDSAHLVAMPLRTAPTKAHVEALRAAIKGRERVEAKGRTAYFVYPDGIGPSKLTIRVIESKLETTGTARNWNTVRKLAEAAKGTA